MMRSLQAAGRKLPCLSLALPAFLFLLSLCAHLGSPALAAVRLCKDEISSGLVSAATEPQARKAALDAWKEKARKSGDGYTSWRLASPKFLKCLPAKSGSYECLARGAPCMIEQAPSRRHLREKRLGI